MSTDYNSRIADLAYELAKKDCNYVENDDKDNQEKLAKILYRSDINKDIISQQIEATYTVLSQRPDFIPTQSTRGDILNIFEKHLESGNLESITQINDKEFLTLSVLEPIVTNELMYREELSYVLKENHLNPMNNIILTDKLIEMLRKDNLSFEKIDELSKIFENSKPVIKKRNENINKMFSGTDEEKNNAAEYLANKDCGDVNVEYYRKSPNKKSIRGVLIVLARKAYSSDLTLNQDACLLAAKAGLGELINPNGRIDLHKVYDKLKESIVGEPNLQKKFSSYEDFEKVMKSVIITSRENCVRAYVKDEKFRKDWESCKTDEEKDKLIRDKKTNFNHEIQIFNKINENLKLGNIEEAKKLMQSVSHSNRHNIKHILSGLIKNNHLESEFGGYVNDLFKDNSRDSKESQVDDLGEK